MTDEQYFKALDESIAGDQRLAGAAMVVLFLAAGAVLTVFSLIGWL